MQEAGSWMWDDTPHHQRQFGSSAPLIVKKTRRERIGTAAQGQEIGPWSGSSAATFSAGCGVRRAPKSLALISNLRDTLADASWPATNGQMHPFPLKPLSPAETLNGQQRPEPAYVLTPHVEVTSEVAALDNGQHTWWVAIEVSGRPSPVTSGEINLGTHGRSGICMGRTIEQGQGVQFEFGHLYDLNIEVLPTANSSILQVLRAQTFPITIGAGSTVLILAQIRIDLEASQDRKSRYGHAQQNSDEMIEDLVAELGDSDVGYSHVRLSYRHTAFPTLIGSDMSSWGSGVSSVQSRVDTVATASVKFHNSLSLWSPRPAQALGSLPLLIQRHWGAESAAEAMRRMANYDDGPRMIAQANTPFPIQACLQIDADHDAHVFSMPASSAHKAPPVPLRRTSLHRNTQAGDSVVARDPVNKAKRVTSRQLPTSSSQESSSPNPSWAGKGIEQPACVTRKLPDGIMRPQSPATAEQDVVDLSESVLRKKRSPGAETLRDAMIAATATGRGGPMQEAPTRVKKDAVGR